MLDAGLLSQAPVDEEAVKAQAREHNLAAAREAEARKQRRLKEKERKKARAQEAKSRAAVYSPVASCDLHKLLSWLAGMEAADVQPSLVLLLCSTGAAIC